MSDKTFGPDDPLSAAQVAAAVAAARPDWTLVEADPIAEGSDVLYRVRVATGDDGGDGPEPADADRVVGSHERTAVLKYLRQSGPLSFRSTTDFLTEVELLDLVGAETAVPVPDVYGVYDPRAEGRAVESATDDDETVDGPLFLMEDVDGVNAETVPVDDDPAVAERLARESGRYLARIHDLRSFDAFGPVAPGADDLTVPDGYDDVTGYVRDGLEYALDNLAETRFADLEGPLRDHVDARLAAFDRDVDPVLLHGDYRRGNLLVDAATGGIEAVIDWGAPAAGDRLDELVWVEADLAGNAPPDSPLRRRVRAALFDAYEAERGVAFDRGAAFDDRRRLYRFVSWVTEMRWFPYWHEDVSEAERADRATWLREAVESTLDDGDALAD